MPNYNITIDSKFDPYSFEDYLKPAMLMQEQHNQAADAYANYLAQSAGMEEALAANPNDIDLLNQYNTYRQTLNNLADDLSKNGISRTTRRGAYQAKAEYGDIAKMQEAIKTRDELLRERRGLRIQDPSLIFSNEDSDYSIKNVMAGKTNYDALSKNVIMKDVEDRAKNWAKSAMIHMQQNDIIDPQSIKYGYIFRKILNGATPQEIVGAINSGKIEGVNSDDPIVDELKSIVDSSVDKYISAGARDANGQSVWENRRGDIRDAAAQGLWSALGDIDYSPIQDFMGRYNRANKATANEVFGGYQYDVQTGITTNNPDLHGNDNIQQNLPNDVNKALSATKRMVQNTNGNWESVDLKDGEYLGLGLNPDNANTVAEQVALKATVYNANKNFSEFLANKDLSDKDKEMYKKFYNDLLTYDVVSKNTYLGKDYKDMNVDDFRKIYNEFKDYANGQLILSHADTITGLPPAFYRNYLSRLSALSDGGKVKTIKGITDKGTIVEGKVVNDNEVPDWLAKAEKDPLHVHVNIKLVDNVTGETEVEENGKTKKKKNHGQRQILEVIDKTGKTEKRYQYLMPDISVMDDNKEQWVQQYEAKDDLADMLNNEKYVESINKVKSGKGSKKDFERYNEYMMLFLSANSMQDDNVTRFIRQFPSQSEYKIHDTFNVGYSKEKGNTSNDDINQG